MKITAAICTYNRERYLPQLFDSIKKQTLAKGQFEIILIDNNSPGNTKEICEQFNNDNPDFYIEYFLETQQGLSFARNRSIKESKTELITFLDDDAFIDPDYLEKKVNYFMTHKDIVAIGSKILLHFEEIKPNWSNKYINPILGYYDQGETAKYLKFPEYPRGSNMTFRKELFNTIGDFNTALGRIGSNMLGGEEKDLFARIHSRPHLHVLYVPDAIVYHCVPLSRTTPEFVKSQATGIGSSERIRMQLMGKSSYWLGLLQELKKWFASALLSLLYCLSGRLAAAKMLLQFRYWVSCGLLGAKR